MILGFISKFLLIWLSRMLVTGYNYDRIIIWDKPWYVILIKAWQKVKALLWACLVVRSESSFSYFVSFEPGRGCDDPAESSLEWVFGGLCPWLMWGVDDSMLILGAGIITRYFPFLQLFPLFAPGGCCGLEDQTKLLGFQT